MNLAILGKRYVIKAFSSVDTAVGKVHDAHSSLLSPGSTAFILAHAKTWK